MFLRPDEWRATMPRTSVVVPGRAESGADRDLKWLDDFMPSRTRKLNNVWVFWWRAVVLLVAAVPARAHHSFAAVFDANQPVTVQGVVAEVRLENPHSWFFIDVKNASGKVERWASKPAPRRHCSGAASSPGFIKTGDTVTIKGYHARDASQNAGAAREIVLADGRAFAVGPTFGGR